MCVSDDKLLAFVDLVLTQSRRLAMTLSWPNSLTARINSGTAASDPYLMKLIGPIHSQKYPLQDADRK